MRKRREILEKNVKVIRNHIEVSEQYRLTKLEDLKKLMGRVLKEGLEGLVVKVRIRTLHTYTHIHTHRADTAQHKGFSLWLAQ